MENPLQIRDRERPTGFDPEPRNSSHCSASLRYKHFLFYFYHFPPASASLPLVFLPPPPFLPTSCHLLRALFIFFVQSPGLLTWLNLAANTTAFQTIFPVWKGSLNRSLKWKIVEFKGFFRLRAFEEGKERRKCYLGSLVVVDFSVGFSFIMLKYRG